MTVEQFILEAILEDQTRKGEFKFLAPAKEITSLLCVKGRFRIRIKELEKDLIAGCN